MSLSNNTSIENPCKKWIEYSGKTGKFSYYDKETKTKIPVDKLRFVVLDELSTITGFNNSLQCGIYANEVHDISKQELNVKSFKPGIQIKGMYSDIKNDVKASGGKFCKSVYVLLAETTGMILACIKMEGSALNGWIDKKCKTYKNIITVESFENRKNGANEYIMPVFTSAGELEGVALENAIQQDKLLQEYFKHYENQKPSEEIQKNETAEGVDFEAIAMDEIGVEELSSVNPLLQNPKKEIKSTSDNQPGTEADNSNLPF